MDDKVQGFAFFKKSGEKDPTFQEDLLEPLTEEELDILKISKDPKTTLKDKGWESAICFEFIDPQFKGIHKKGHIRLIFFEDEKRGFQVYLDEIRIDSAARQSLSGGLW